MKIETTEVTKKSVHLGWKVYIDGEKFPKKPRDFYDVTLEQTAIMFAIQDAQFPRVKK
jgi:hypothetical protein